MSATIFLRQPTGVRIETDQDRDWEALLLQQDVITVHRRPRYEGARSDVLVIPVDNIASVEVAQ